MPSGFGETGEVPAPGAGAREKLRHLPGSPWPCQDQQDENVLGRCHGKGTRSQGRGPGQPDVCWALSLSQKASGG